jgi:hypothetical protein
MEWIASYFWICFQEKGTAEKGTEKGATERVFLPPVTPGSTILP